MTTEPPKLAPCPHCDHPYYLYLTNHQRNRIRVMCLACDSQGAVGSTQEEAAMFWNTRAPNRADRVLDKIKQQLDDTISHQGEWTDVDEFAVMLGKFIEQWEQEE